MRSRIGPLVEPRSARPFVGARIGARFVVGTRFIVGARFVVGALLFIGAMLVVSTSVAHADVRAYGTTYEAVTAPKGELDVELWTTYAHQGEVDGGPASRGVRQMVELEYGVTDRWDAALYNMLDLVSGDTASGYAGFKIESRFRPSFRGEWFVDPIIYAEFQQLFRGDANQKYELKLILAKDFGKVNVAVNAAFEEERTTDATWNPEFEYAAGTSYELSPALKIGGEIFGKLESEPMVGTENRLWAGPAVSWATTRDSILHGIWVTVAAGAGIQGDADAVYGRLIVGLQF